MILPQILHRKSLFYKLYQIDLELSLQTQAKGCPIAGDRCIAPTMNENLEALPLILMRPMNFVLAYAVAVQAAADVYCRHQYGFGGGECTGHRSCC
jgi:hypothetical protein